MIHLRHHGKLFVMGEYSIMEPGSNAVLIPVRQGIDTYVESSNALEIVTQYGTYAGEETPTEALLFVDHAYRTAIDYLIYRGVQVEPFKMTLVSDLMENGRKYGFGSSGVVGVSVIHGILEYHEVKTESYELFKLAMFAQSKAGVLGSGGDVAVAVYGVPIVYTRFDMSCIQERIECVFENWTGLHITPIALDFSISVGWTGSPSSTHRALSEIDDRKRSEASEYQRLCASAQLLVSEFIDYPDARLKCIDAYQHWMEEFQDWSGKSIVTPAIQTAILLANRAGSHAKVSGAGGGDCVISCHPKDFETETLFSTWRTHGILPVII